MDILFSLALTLFIELIIYSFLKPFDFKFTIWVTFLNVILNTAMNTLLLSTTSYFDYYFLLVACELFTFIFEALVISSVFKLNKKSTFVFAFIANMLSLSAGFIINQTKLIHNKNFLIITSSIMLSCVAFYIIVLAVFHFFPKIKAYLVKIYRIK